MFGRKKSGVFSSNSGRVGCGRRRPRALPEAERGPGARGRTEWGPEGPLPERPWTIVNR
jgi:hypothetical protein